MNSWSFGEIKRQIEYKARWLGIPIIRLTKGETRNTSTVCPRCGERLQFGQYKSRQLWCPSCKMWEDRDVLAAKNLSRKGLLRFGSSLPSNDNAKGGAAEAMRGNPTTAVILGADAPKSTHPTKS
jgi:putative transposase